MKTLFSTLAASALTAGVANAAEIFVTADIATSTTWTADNTYNLQGQIYVLPGATLTIEPGTVVASDTNGGGSLAITRGAQLFALGEAGAPVVMTSKADVATWAAADPSTGTWRESANEWGNLTIMGSAYISENAIPGNTATPSASNYGDMEGLTPPAGSTVGRYGGGDDDDDSGTIQYLSIRYGGRVVGLNNELNGLSLGGLGRGTDMHHIEIMNNVDDGIEIWGGTFNLKYFSIWNIGDDSLDIDQGWRGKAQFGLIVQGHSLNASQGSGVGDNCCEFDGAEDSDWQPVTTASLYNMTIIGQPLDGDGATAWRDGARVQIRNSVIMDCGEQVVRPDDNDGDGASGYGHNGTLTFAQVWTTPYTSLSNVNAPAGLATFYQAQSSGNLAEITETVFFRNLASSAYTEANLRGVFNASNNNILAGAAAQPIANIVRAPLIVRGGKNILPVIGLDPRPTNDAAAVAPPAPEDGFFTAARYRGAFSPNTANTWLCGWTASEAFGFTAGNCVGVNYCDANTNSTGNKGTISAYGSASVAANNLTLEASNLPVNAFLFFIASTTEGFVANPNGSQGNLCVLGNIGRYVGPGQIQTSGTTGVGTLAIDLTQIPQPNGFVSAVPGQTWNFSTWHRDVVGGVASSNFTNGVAVTFTN